MIKSKWQCLSLPVPPGEVWLLMKAPRGPKPSPPPSYPI